MCAYNHPIQGIFVSGLVNDMSYQFECPGSQDMTVSDIYLFCLIVYFSVKQKEKGKKRNPQFCLGNLHLISLF